MRALAFLPIFALAGCTAFHVADAVQITPRQVFTLESGYAVVREGFVVYRQQPYCSNTVPAPCQEKSVARQIQKADSAAMEAIHALDVVSATGDTVGLRKAYAVAQAAVDAATAIATTYGAK